MSLDVSVQIPGTKDPYVIRNAEPGGDPGSPALNVYNMAIVRGLLMCVDYWKRIDVQSAAVESNTKNLETLTAMRKEMDTWSNSSWTPPLGTYPTDSNYKTDAKVAAMVEAGLVDHISLLAYVENPPGPGFSYHTPDLSKVKPLPPAAPQTPPGIYRGEDGTLRYYAQAWSSAGVAWVPYELDLSKSQFMVNMTPAEWQSGPGGDQIAAWKSEAKALNNVLGQVSTVKQGFLHELMAGYDKCLAMTYSFAAVQAQVLNGVVRNFL